MSHKLLDLYREIRPNAAWDFIKLGVGLMLASLAGLGYWFIQQYREAPFSVIVMFTIFAISFIGTLVLFGYQKLKVKETADKLWYETPENDLTTEKTVSNDAEQIKKPNLVYISTQFPSLKQDGFGVFHKSRHEDESTSKAITIEFRNDIIAGLEIIPAENVQAQIFYYTTYNHLEYQVTEGVWIGEKDSIVNFERTNTRELLIATIPLQGTMAVYDNKRGIDGQKTARGFGFFDKLYAYVCLTFGTNGERVRTFKFEIEQDRHGTNNRCYYVGEAALPSREEKKDPYVVTCIDTALIPVTYEQNEVRLLKKAGRNPKTTPYALTAKFFLLATKEAKDLSVKAIVMVHQNSGDNLIFLHDGIWLNNNSSYQHFETGGFIQLILGIYQNKKLFLCEREYLDNSRANFRPIDGNKFFIDIQLIGKRAHGVETIKKFVFEVELQPKFYFQLVQVG